MIFQKTIHQNFINILISQYKQKNQNHFLGIQNIIGSPNFAIIPIKTIEYPSFGMVRIPRTIPKTSSPGPSHPPATVAAQNALPEGAPRTWGLAKECPPQSDQSVYYTYIYLFICNYNIYILQRKLSLRESATTNKFWTAWEMLQPMLRQIG